MLPLQLLCRRHHGTNHFLLSSSHSLSISCVCLVFIILLMFILTSNPLPVQARSLSPVRNVARVWRGSSTWRNTCCHTLASGHSPASTVTRHTRVARISTDTCRHTPQGTPSLHLKIQPWKTGVKSLVLGEIGVPDPDFPSLGDTTETLTGKPPLKKERRCEEVTRTWM